MSQDLKDLCPAASSGADITSAGQLRGKTLVVGNGVDAPVIALSVKMIGGAAASGETLIWDTSKTDGVSVKGNAGADQVAVAGVALESIASGSYGKMAIAGLATVKVNGNTTNIAAGDRLSTGTVALRADKVATAAPGGVLGIALEAATTANKSILCMVKLA